MTITPQRSTATPIDPSHPESAAEPPSVDELLGQLAQLRQFVAQLTTQVADQQAALSELNATPPERRHIGDTGGTHRRGTTEATPVKREATRRQRASTTSIPEAGRPTRSRGWLSLGLRESRNTILAHPPGLTLR